MPPRTDEELLLEAGRGDREAFTALVERRQGAILRFVHRFLATADRDTAEELAQQAFIGAWKAAPTFKPRARVLTWLFRITTHVCLNHKRALRLRYAVPLDSDDVAEPAPSDPADPPAVEREEAQRVRRVVAELPPTQRAAVILRYFEEFSYVQIAEILDTSVPAVESLLFRARRSLRNKLIEQRIVVSPQGSPAGGAEQIAGENRPDAMLKS